MEPSSEHQYISFYTATILHWKKLLKPDKYKQVVIDSLCFLVKEGRVKVYGFVIMPNHIHLLWKIKEGTTLSSVQRDFMKFTSQQIKFDLSTHHPNVLKHFEVNLIDRKYQFWKRKSKNVFLYSRNVVEQKLDYIHRNPVSGKWNLVDNFIDYKFSSAKYYYENEIQYQFLSHYMEEYE